MDTKKSRSLHLKGSVLFTVLIVMMIILIIMLSAIGLAGAASKRAYSTWYDNQTKYTAQDLVDNVIETFGEGKTNALLGEKIVKSLSTKGSSVKVDVGFDTDGDNVIDDTYVPGYGKIQSLTFMYVADNATDFTISGLTGHDNQKIIKVTAVVEMGGEYSTYSRYVVGNLKANSTDSNGGGFIATNTLKSGTSSNDGPGTIGRMYAGIEIKKDEDKYEAGSANDSTFGGDVFFNVKKFVMQESGTKVFLGRNDPDNGFYGGMRVTGDLEIGKALIVGIESNYPPSYMTDCSSEKFYNIPYLYVDGTLSGSKGLNVTSQNGTEGVLNLYCNKINMTSAELNGNINLMLMGEGESNKIVINSSELLNWVTRTVSNETQTQGDKLKGNTVKSGSVYCKGDFETEGNTMTVNGDLFVVGDLKVSNTMTVKGSVYVGKNLTVVSDGDKGIHGALSATGSVYVGGTVTNEAKINPAVTKLSSAVSNTDGFIKEVNKVNAGAASDFKTAITTEDTGKGLSYIQTLSNIRSQIRDNTGKFVGVEEQSGFLGNKDFVINYTDNIDEYTITESCNWTSSSNLGTEINKTIRIVPGDDDIWINIKNGVTAISMKTIIVDDSGTGSVKFFVEENTSGREIKLNKTNIITQTYYDYFFGSKKGQTLEFSSYPGGKLVPHIYMYSPTDSKVVLDCTNEFLYTGDIVMPGGTYKGKSSNTELDIKYTYYMYSSGSSDKLNPVTINGKKKIQYIGSLEVGNIDVDNKFGYFYADDPPTNTGGPGLTGGYTWTTVDGYSTY